MIKTEELNIDESLYELVVKEIVPGTGINDRDVWRALNEIVRDLGPKNLRLLERRRILERQIDQWHLERRTQRIDWEDHATFLKEIGYLIPEGDDFQISTNRVDSEISEIAGPQLVVPVNNARYALNAANARWGSLYDAFYGADIISEEDGAQRRDIFNPSRGVIVVARTEALLDKYVSLDGGKYSEVLEFLLRNREGRDQLIVKLKDGRHVGLVDAAKFVGFAQTNGQLDSVLLVNNALHIEIQIDRNHPIGRGHPAGVKDVLLEAAITTIQDCEDSVAAVDAKDKACIYRNWLELMKGTLKTSFEKENHIVARELNPDKTFSAPDGRTFSIPGRSLLLVRNVGIHMYTDAVTTSDGLPIPEGFLDALITSLAAIHDLKRLGRFTNSRTGSIYIVKPKLHGPEEVAATIELFTRIESALGLEPRTIKIGIMDEERRTTVNLKECIRQARDRVFFINTGFLDRTADEIHTSMEAGPVIPKMEIKNARWILAYEDWNVDVGIASGFRGKAQIGKGMWTMPDQMHAMLESKGVHPKAGANTAWVPSPTAATLHALHYHEVDVYQRQMELANRPKASLNDILTPPLLGTYSLTPEKVLRELENNAQGILGYVIRWVEQGIGCSKVPDINNVGLMEDRATLRISSQHVANWLHHGIILREQIIQVFKKMATIVDRQNAGSPGYRNMSPAFNSTGFQAALDLVFNGRSETNGYTERILAGARREFKKRSALTSAMSGNKETKPILQAVK